MKKIGNIVFPSACARAGELYELGGPGVESEGLVDVVFPDDVLEPSFPDVGQLDFHRRHWDLPPLTFASRFRILRSPFVSRTIRILPLQCGQL